MKKVFRLCAVSAALAGAAGAAGASTAFTFSPLGNAGGANSVTATTLDQAPGNALAIAGNTAVFNCAIAGGFTGAVGVYSCPGAAGVQTQFVYQANLAQLTNLGSPVFNQNDLGQNFTFTASFNEIVTKVAVLDVLDPDGAGPLPSLAIIANANFVLAPSQTNNFFRMYFTGAAGGNDLTGAGFAPVNATNPILEGVATISSSTSTSDRSCFFTTAGCGDLDNFANNPQGNDQWNDFKTVSNNGSTQVTFSVTAANANYFPDLPIGTLITLDVNTSQVVPFNQANPACAMISQAGVEQGYTLGTFAAGSCTADTTKLGPVNGLGFNPATGTVAPDFLFQADANSSLQFERVPEPGTLALLAGGLMAAGVWRRRGSST